MKIHQLLWKEIRYRNANFLLAAGTVTLAVTCSVALVLLVRGYQAHTQARVAGLDDEIRKITKGMGFNINILPRDQNLADFHANDFGEKTMPQEFVQRLADSRDIVTVNHLRAALIRKVTWSEHQRDVILMGVTGVVPWTHRANKKQPLSEAVPPGQLNLGHVLAEQLNLEPGQAVAFCGREFAVHKVYEPRGSKDDITVWMDLAAVQDMLALPDQINLIQALECNCSSVDRLAEIEQEIAGVLGEEVQVIELATKAIARARAREDVRISGQQTLATLRRSSLYGFLFTTVVASLIVALLSLLNASQRRREIGILRAIGTPLRKILALFVGKAALLGLIGALVGFLLGLLLASLVGHVTMEGFAYPAGTAGGLLVAALLATPLLTILASWIPALLAAGQDPASVLRNE
jgi:ABC-type lipoprotein release transport system permease subunit